MKTNINGYNILIATSGDSIDNREIYSTHLYIYDNEIRKNHIEHIQYYSRGNFISDFEIDLVLKSLNTR